MVRLEEGSSGPGSTRGHVVRWVLAVCVFLGLGYLLLMGSLHWFADAEYVEEIMNPPLAEATDSLYRGEIGSVGWGVNPRSVRLDDVAVAPDTTVSGTLDPATRPAGHLRLSIAEFGLTGIHLWGLLWRRALRVDEIAILTPDVRVRNRGADRGDDVFPDSLLSSNGSSPFGGTGFADVRVDHVRLTGGRFAVDRGSEAPSDSMWGISAQAGSFSADSVQSQPIGSLLASRVLEGQFEGFRRDMPEAAYRIQLGPTQASADDSTWSVRNARLTTTVSDSMFMQRRRYRANRFQTSIGRFLVDGFQFERFVNQGAVHADRIRIDTMDVDVYRDNHLPEREGEAPPPTPHEAFQSLERAVTVDTVQVRASRIGYVKRPENVPETGSITFTDLWSTVYNVSNDPDRMTSSTPAVVDLSSKVVGAGPLDATIRLPLLSPDLSFSFQGRVGSMDPMLLNEAFVNLGGVRITGGELDSLWFDATVASGQATGTVGGVYRDLEVETLDKTTGERGVGSRLKTAVVDGMALRRRNVPTEGRLDTGQIQHEYAGEHSFFKYLWLTLRSGIYSLVGIDRIPGQGS